MKVHGPKIEGPISLLLLNKQITIIFFGILFLGGCGIAATRPKLEMSLAAAAFLAAKEAKSNVMAPNLYRKAELFYLKAKSSYRRKYFNKAKQYALLSQQYSEKAEFISIRKATLDSDASGGNDKSGGAGDKAAAPPPSSAPPETAPAPAP